MLEIPEIDAKVFVPIVEVWKAELAALGRDPTVRKFFELQDKIEASDASWPSFRPYDLYDVFEFGRDLTGRQISNEHVTRMAHDRFPETSEEGRQAILHFLVDHEHAVVARRTDAGDPASYRFAPPRNKRAEEKWVGMGLLTNELSRFKEEDLEDVDRLPPPDRGSPPE